MKTKELVKVVAVLTKDALFKGDPISWTPPQKFWAVSVLRAVGDFVKARTKAVEEHLREDVRQLGEPTKGGGYKLAFKDGSATLVRQVRKSFDVEALKEVLSRKRIAKAKAIRQKVVEEVDEEGLAALLKAGLLTEEDLEGCVDKKEIWALRVKKPSTLKPLLEGRISPEQAVIEEEE